MSSLDGPLRGHAGGNRAETKAGLSPLPWQTREEIANITLHALGFLSGIVGFGILIAFAAMSGSLNKIISSSVYAMTLIALYLASVVYHTSLAIDLPWKKAGEVLDHSAIYLLIAGTYTPFLMVSVGGVAGWSMLALIWSLALAGVFYKVFFYYGSDLLSTLAYIAMGWLIMLVVKPLYLSIGWSGVGMIVLGGILYSCGAWFYLNDQRFRFAHALWHIFVLGGSFCHYIAILRFVIMA